MDKHRIIDGNKKKSKAYQSPHTMSGLSEAETSFRSMTMATREEVRHSNGVAPKFDSGIQSRGIVNTTSSNRKAPAFSGLATRRAPTISPQSSIKLPIQKKVSRKLLVSQGNVYNKPTFESVIGTTDGDMSEWEPKIFSVNRTWYPKARPIPEFYPLERSSVHLATCYYTLELITSGLFDCFRILGLQVRYLPAGAALLTPELVEICIYFWKKSDEYIIEIQRRYGDAVVFHKYAQFLLDAAAGKFEAEEYKDFSDSQYLNAVGTILKTELTSDRREDSLVAIDLTAQLLRKDRLDARLLGMESLCILTDPRKTNFGTVLTVSRAIVEGRFDGHENLKLLHEFVLHIVQTRTMEDEDTFVRDMDVDYDSDDEDHFQGATLSNEPPEYHNAMNAMVHYGLKILSNAWEVVTLNEKLDVSDKSLDTMVEKFFGLCRELTNHDVLKTLLYEIHDADTKLHNACHAAKCLRIICQTSSSALKKVKKLRGQEIASCAAEVGGLTSFRLERECVQLQQVLA